MSSKKIVITGGAGFVGTNLIRLLLKKTKYKLISIDNYSSSSRKNHIKNSRVKYIKAHTKNISKKFIRFFILVSLQEFIKVFYKWTNVSSRIQLEQTLF